ncbi:MAG TPA: pentapeptide repeat-containing protein [Mycobacteriales bacterium]|jgi:uncharacterized protein YjbI with pentapeptide repeats|nr:pentapeptide repeat-containing protein [Mycobacteriales bacterium]
MRRRDETGAGPTTDREIRSEDWDGRDLSHQVYERTAFVDVDMTDTTGAAAVFTECVFRNCHFNCAVHTNTAFTNCTFANCDFFDATLTGCKMMGSTYERCSFNLLKVIDGDWSFVGLVDADLHRASFAGTRMREADLTRARVQGGSLRDVDLSGAWLHGADLSGCDLRGSDLSAIDPRNTEIKGAIINLEQTVVLARALGLDVRSPESG